MGWFVHLVAGDREVKVLRAIDHPGVPAMIDAFEDQADNTVQLYIVTELVPGQDLSRCIEEGMRWDEAKARSAGVLAIQIAPV